MRREKRREEERENAWSALPTVHATPRWPTLFFTSLFWLTL